MPKYAYDGPVMEFERVLTDRWKSETYAPTEGKAISNLKFQFKKSNNKIAGTKISLPGKLRMIG